jgi:hypothetical protein
MKEKLKRALLIATAPFALAVVVATASAVPASASTAASHAPSQTATTAAPASRAGYPSIWSLECNAITWQKIGENPITGQLYVCEYEEGIGYLWVPLYVCPNTADRIVNIADRPTKTC